VVQRPDAAKITTVQLRRGPVQWAESNKSSSTLRPGENAHKGGPVPGARRKAQKQDNAQGRKCLIPALVEGGDGTRLRPMLTRVAAHNGPSQSNPRRCEAVVAHAALGDCSSPASRAPHKLIVSDAFPPFHHSLAHEAVLLTKSIPRSPRSPCRSQPGWTFKGGSAARTRYGTTDMGGTVLWHRGRRI